VLGRLFREQVRKQEGSSSGALQMPAANAAAGGGGNGANQARLEPIEFHEYNWNSQLEAQYACLKSEHISKDLTVRLNVNNFGAPSLFHRLLSVLRVHAPPAIMRTPMAAVPNAVSLPDWDVGDDDADADAVDSDQDEDDAKHDADSEALPPIGAQPLLRKHDSLYELRRAWRARAHNDQMFVYALPGVLRREEADLGSNLVAVRLPQMLWIRTYCPVRPLLV
jgi:hypothetical protein